MPAEPPDQDPVDADPRERGLQRRAGGPAVSPWVILVLILMAAALAYVAFALL